MKRWRVLCSALLLCGICLNGLCVPVSAADEPATMLYNGVELPNIETLWTDKERYPCALLFVGNSGAIYLHLCSGEWFISDGSDDLYTPGYSSYVWYKYTDGAFVYHSDFRDSSPAHYILDHVFWTSFDLYCYKSGTLFLSASDPVDPNAPTGTMEIISTQVLDDSASFVVSVAGLTSTESVYSFRYELYSGGALVSSHDHSEVFAGPSDMLHATIPNLSPQTEYEIVFSLLDNGVETGLSVSTTFTTLTGSGTGEGEGDGDSTTPDYSGQLGSIQSGIDNVQQGIGEVKDSVDGVGETLEGVQDTLTETKEEITSLPQKIATALTDGIKGLFIPSQEDLTAIKEEYENMLSEKLGFIWQAFDLLTSFVGDLQTNLESGKAYEFTFPGVKLPMQGEEFVLVAETAVSLENDLMDVLRPVLGTIVSIVCVTAFVNMGHDYVLAIISGVSAYQFERRKEQ